MDREDPEIRSANLERELAQQKRIAGLERQLAEAKAPAGEALTAEPPRPLDAPKAVAGGNRRMPVGAILAVLGSLLGLCVGAAAALTAVVPASALWMGWIVCPGGYDLTYGTSSYSYKPGQSGTTVSYQCVSGDSAYDVNDLAVIALQCVLVGLLVGVAGWLTWRLTRTRS